MDPIVLLTLALLLDVATNLAMLYLAFRAMRRR